MFNLERSEKILLIVLLSVFLSGAGAMVYKKLCPVGSLRIETSDGKILPQGKLISKKDKKININKAPLEELMGLKGVGKVLAGHIVEYRLTKGSFAAKEDLKKVPGIGDKLFLKIQDDIWLE